MTRDLTVWAIEEADTGRTRALYAEREFAEKALACLTAQGLDTTRLVVTGRTVYGADRLVLHRHFAEA